jgi:phosphatidylglycerophosphate synthase
LSRSALLFATTAAADGAPAAVLPVGGETAVGRLLGQLGTLGVRRASVITRPEWVGAIEAALAGSAAEVAVIASGGLAEDLGAAATVARAARDELVVATGDIAAHREALAGLLADPRINTGILATASRQRGRWSFATRSARGRLVGAASAYHRVRRGNAFFLGVMKVDPADVERLAAGATRLAELAADPPASWELELARKGEEWRRRLWRAAVLRATGIPPEPDDPPEAPELEAEDEAELALRDRAARVDATSLLLVGLVRGGAHVSSSYLRGFFYARPLSAAAARAAEDDMREVDEDRVALDAAVKSADGFFTTFFVSPYSKYIARFAARRGWTPNAVSAVAMLIGAAAAAAFATGSRAGLIAGAVLLQAAFTMDCVDGQLARYTRTFSKLGAWLDSVFDRGKEYLVYAGLAIGSTRGFGDDVWTLACCAIALQTARHMVDFSYAAGRHHAIAETSHRPLEEADEIAVAVDAARRPELAGAGVRALRPALAGSVAPDLGRPSVLPASARPDGPADAGAAPPAARAMGLPGLARLGVGAITALERWPASRWAKRIVSLPIGERFALISVTAAAATPRVTFSALLGWGSVAAVYSVGGRVLRSVAR